MTNNKNDRYEIISYDENNFCLDNKIIVCNEVKEILKQNLDIVDIIFDKWSLLKRNYLMDIFKKYIPDEIQIDLSLKLHYILFKINSINKFNK